MLKVLLPKACMQQSLCRQSLAQLFEATAIESVMRVNLTNIRECDVGCDCHVLLHDDKCGMTGLLILDWTYAEF